MKAEDLQEQILDTAKKTDVLKDYIFENEVISAHYDAGRNRWEIATDKGLHFSATYFLTALGILTNPYIPKFSGIESFKGLFFHSARWPKGLDVSGKRIAVIGRSAAGRV